MHMHINSDTHTRQHTRLQWHSDLGAPRSNHGGVRHDCQGS